LIGRIAFAVEWTFATTVAVVAAHLAVEIVGSALLQGISESRGSDPYLGLAQARMLRRWGRPTRLWVIASTGWSGFFAVEVFRMKTLPAVDELAGRLVSGIAGYSVGSSVGATLLGGLIAGGITGIALAVVMGGTAETAKDHLPGAAR
jgi:hypothetical protein